MTRRRRAALLAGLAIVLGALAASDVAGREAALRARVGAPVRVVVARTSLARGARIELARLAVRRVPARYAPRDAVGDPRALAGLRTAVPVPAGTDLTAAMVDDGASRRVAPGAPVRPGERIAEVVAAAPAALMAPGARVDVLVTRERGGSGAGETALALQDAEVLAARPAPAAGGGDAAPRVAVSLRVTLRQAVYLAAAQAFAREIRLLPRPAADHRRAAAGMRVGSGL